MRLILPHDDQANHAIGNWVATKLGTVLYPPFYAAGIARDDNDKLVGALVFNDFNGFQIELTAYGPGALSPSVLKQVSEYVFNQLGVERVSARTRKSNVRTRRLLAKHFEFEGVLKRYYGKEDALLYRMFREECPWLKVKKNEIGIAA